MSTIESPSWLCILHETELIKQFETNVMFTLQIDSEKTFDEIGNSQLPIAIDGNVRYSFWPDYWEQLKKEFSIFICSNDEKYSKVKRKLSSNANKSQTAIVSAISAAMASQFGVVPGVMVPFVVMCLLVLARIGVEAFCSTETWDFPIKINK